MIQETTKHTYQVTVTRDDDWWMVHIPELNGLTQARFLGEIELMAREWISLTQDIPLKDVSVIVSEER